MSDIIDRVMGQIESEDAVWIDEDTVLGPNGEKIVIKRAPKLKWGDEFKNWDVDRKLLWLTRFAESMNHAADELQKNRDECLVRIEYLERVNENLGRQIDQIKDINQKMSIEASQQQQTAAKEIKSLVRELKEARKKLKERSNGNNNNVGNEGNQCSQGRHDADSNDSL